MMVFVDAPAGSILASTSWAASSSWTLTALPLFIWMGEILYKTKLSEQMFRGLAPWLDRLPGRLVHVNVVGCGIFAAVSGSSAATAATIGRISLPELKARGYDDAISVGSLAGAGTLGLMIPPSLMMIVYGVAAQVSIAKLFIAGVLPGLLLISLFSGYIMIWALMNPAKQPAATISMSFREKLYEARLLIPVVLLIVFVIGSIYTGLATATESACLGVIGALVLAMLTRSMSWQSFCESVMSATRTSCMIAFILLGAAFLTTAMSFTGLPAALAEWITSLGLSKYMLLFCLLILFVVLGCFLDGISIIVLTTAVVMPALQAAQIDLIWFGIFMVLVVEMAQITPPVGFNLFVIQGLTGHNMFYIARAALPFFFLLVASVVLITVFPAIVSYLPAIMFN